MLALFQLLCAVVLMAWSLSPTLHLPGVSVDKTKGLRSCSLLFPFLWVNEFEPTTVAVENSRQNLRDCWSNRRHIQCLLARASLAQRSWPPFCNHSDHFESCFRACAIVLRSAVIGSSHERLCKCDPPAPHWRAAVIKTVLSASKCMAQTPSHGLTGLFTDSILPRGASLEHGRCKQSIFSLSIFDMGKSYESRRFGLGTTV